MSACARLAIISLNGPAPQPILGEGEPANELKALADAARAAAPPPPLPPPVISFAREPHAASGWIARLRAVVSI